MTEILSHSILTCLKCGGAMRTYERSGVLIDQCTECRGIFLDRGELDRIVDAEGSRDGEARLDSGRPRLTTIADPAPTAAPATTGTTCGGVTMTTMIGDLRDGMRRAVLRASRASGAACSGALSTSWVAASNGHA